MAKKTEKAKKTTEKKVKKKKKTERVKITIKGPDSHLIISGSKQSVLLGWGRHTIAELIEPL